MFGALAGSVAFNIGTRWGASSAIQVLLTAVIAGLTYVSVNVVTAIAGFVWVVVLIIFLVAAIAINTAFGKSELTNESSRLSDAMPPAGR
jgi:hypothetical protein